MDESMIVEGLRRGSRQAWGKLYEAHAERLWREVARMTGADAAEVADVVQETFLAAAKSARQFDPDRGSLQSWLRGIARRQFATRYRKRAGQLEKLRRWWAGLDGLAESWLAGAADSPPHILESQELTGLVRETLLALPPRYQDLLSSRYLDGVSAAQIAVDTGATPEAVRARLMRARKAFRDAFTELTSKPARDAEVIR